MDHSFTNGILQFHVRCINQQHVMSNCTDWEVGKIWLRGSYFSRYNSHTRGGKNVQFYAALQINVVSYMRRTMKMHKQYCSTRNIWGSCPFTGPPWILEKSSMCEARKEIDDTLDKMKFKSYLLKQVTVNLKKNKKGRRPTTRRGIKSFVWRRFSMTFCLLLWP